MGYHSKRYAPSSFKSCHYQRILPISFRDLFQWLITLTFKILHLMWNEYYVSHGSAPTILFRCIGEGRRDGITGWFFKYSVFRTTDQSTRRRLFLPVWLLSPFFSIIYHILLLGICEFKGVFSVWLRKAEWRTVTLWLKIICPASCYQMPRK